VILPRRALAALALVTAMMGVSASTATAGGATPSGAVPLTDPQAAGAAVSGLLGAFGQDVADLQAAASRPLEREPPSLSTREVTEIARGSGKLQEWIDEHPVVRDTAKLETDDRWKVSFMSKDATGDEDVEAEVWVFDDTGEIAEVRTGPQVGWLMARGNDGAFGRSVNKPAIWAALSVAFLLPLLRFRRLISMRTLDLLAILSFTASWAWFQQGEIFTSVPLQYPPLVYLGARLVWIGVRRSRALRAEAETASDAPADAEEPTPEPPPAPGLRNWCPTWLMVTILIFALALRFGLNAFDSNVIDVGYAGVIGADLITHGETPYGNFPTDCGRCDTYGPLTYMLYVPFEAVMGFTGKWDSLPAAHGAAVFFDLIAILGMLVLGRRLGGWRLGVVFALAWAAAPWTAYSLESNSNDTLVAACLVWGLAFAGRPAVRGLSVAMAAAAKFTPAILIPLWWRHPFPRANREGGRRRALAFLGGMAGALALTGWVLLLDGFDGVQSIWSRTIEYQVERESPFSIWGQYPGLRPLQVGLTILVLVAAVALIRWPRRFDLVSMAAFSGAVLIGSQLVLEHWFYLYVPWFLPFVLLVVVPEWPGRPALRREPAAPQPVLTPAAEPAPT
jgi:Glycosyltransferase family 87